METYDMVSAGNLDISKLTFEDLRVHYGTGRSYTISGSGRDRKTGYRTGVMTNVGDLEISEWQTLVRQLIESSGEQKLHEQLLQWVKEKTLWCHTKDERENEALKLHAMRIFDNPDWVDYTEFIQRYRPEVLKQEEDNG